MKGNTSNLLPPPEQNNKEVSQAIRSIFDKNKGNKYQKLFENDYVSKIADIVNPYLDIPDKLRKT